MKTCFLITTYCDTEDKLNSLKDTIDRIKRYGHDIILYNHYPINDEVISSVDFSIYDKSNPVIWDMENRSITYWTWVIGTPYKITRSIPDYGYAAAQQWKRGVEFVYNMEYERTYIINYDVKFSDLFFTKASEHLNNNECFAIEYGKNNIYLAFFGVNLSKDFVERFSVVTKNHYIESVGEGITEFYIHLLISDRISKLHYFWEFSEGDIITNVTIAYIDTMTIADGYRVTSGLEKFVFGDETPIYDRLAVLFYDIKMDIQCVIEYDNLVLMELNIPSDIGFMYTHIPIKYSTIDYEKLKFLINGVEDKNLLEYARTVTLETLYQTF
jgi:hypothetical protein